MVVSALLVVSTITFLGVLSNTKRYTFTQRPGAHLRTSTDVDGYVGFVS